jgi:GNAT superfamily N-acetyltransferase
MLQVRNDGAPFEIRPARLEDAPRIAETHVASWVRAYQGIIPAEVLAQQSIDRRLVQWNAVIPALRIVPDRQTVLVAVDGEAIPRGVIHGGAVRDVKSVQDAEVYAIYLHPSAQGMGLGSRLFGHMAAWLEERGFRSLRLWVLEQNPARAFYEQTGGTLLPDQQALYYNGHPVQQVAYGWDSIKALAARLPR